MAVEQDSNIIEGSSGRPVRPLARDVQTYNVDSDLHMIEEALKMQK